MRVEQQEVLKPFNYLLYGLDRPWAVEEIELPVNRNLAECLGQVNQALLKRNVMDHIESIELYKPLEPLLTVTSMTDKWLTTVNNPKAKFQPILPSGSLSKSFTPEELDNRDIVHLIVTIGASSAALTRLQRFYGTQFRNLREAHTSAYAKTPSTAAKLSEFRRIQGSHVPIYNGLTAPGITDNSSTIAMPPSLYHPVFKTWSKNAFDPSIEPPQEVVEITTELMEKASVSYENKQQHSLALRGPLQRLLGRQIDSIVNTDGTVADGYITIQLRRGRVTYNLPALVLEEKHNTAHEPDATIQATFSMIRVWTDAKLDDLSNLTCCPTFLLGFSGSQLEISAAVLTDKCIVVNLATLWVATSWVFDQHQILETARAFHALSTALEELQQWYQSDTIATRDLYDLAANKPFNHARFFPHANQYPVNGEDFGDTIKFEYLCPLETSSRCVTFLAQAVANPLDKFVVKFSQRYCPALHRLLAEYGMAPGLRYCGKIDESTPYGNWKMVVMDYYNGSPPTTEQAPKIREDVKKAVTIGHAAGFVFGDVRRANVLIGKADGQVKLIDFDWAGEEGVRYPVHMSDNHSFWVAGARPMAVIEKQHDLEMIDKYFSK